MLKRCLQVMKIRALLLVENTPLICLTTMFCVLIIQLGGEYSWLLFLGVKILLRHPKFIGIIWNWANFSLFPFRTLLHDQMFFYRFPQGFEIIILCTSYQFHKLNIKVTCLVTRSLWKLTFLCLEPCHLSKITKRRYDDRVR